MHHPVTLTLLTALLSLTYPLSSADFDTVSLFRMLPNEHFEASIADVHSWMLRPDRGAIIDERHGYIAAKGDGAQRDLDFCRWNDLGIVAVAYCDWDKSGVFDSFIRFYKISGIKLIPITQDWVKPDHLYALPRYGRDIIEYDTSLHVTAIVKHTSTGFSRAVVP